MSVRNKIIAILDVVLRVPPVFMLDSIFMNGFKELSRHMFLGDNDAGGDEDYENSLDPIGMTASIPAANFTSYSRENPSSNLFASSDTTGNSTNVSNDIYLMRQFLTVIVYVIAFFLSIIVFLLPTKSLFSVYLWISSILLVIWSYISNEYYVQYVSQLNRSSLPDELFSLEASSLQVWRRLLQNYFLQIFLSMAFCYLSSNLYRSKILLSKRVVAVFFVIPTIISWLPGSLPSSTKSWVNLLLSEHVLGTNDALYRSIRSLAVSFSPLVSLNVGLLYILINLLADSKTIIRELYQDYEWSKTIVRHYGTYTLIENQWVRLHVPQVLRVFWLTRLVEHAVHLIAESEASWTFYEYGFLKLPSDPSVISTAAKTLIVKGCETIIAVLGMTSILSSISHQIGCGIQWFLAIEDPEDRNIGTVSALLFFILALQTGITGMEPEKRFQRLYRNICLLFTAILHFIHNMVNPLLNSLSASRNMSIQRHARALTVCLFLITFPVFFLIYLWKNEASVTTWLLAVSAFSIEVVIKVIISLMIYVLFMIDAFRTTLWEPLDDYVYYIKATGSTIEFIFGIFLFCNGAYILLFESGGTIRALMMCIHAYFNIWLQAKQGWQKFMRRRQAVDKINSLPEASEQQLIDFDDVCAICYQELTSARITRCNHYFHSVCLRKWLYVQDICPLCHEVLCPVPENTATTENANNNNNNTDNLLQQHQEHIHPEDVILHADPGPQENESSSDSSSSSDSLLDRLEDIDEIPNEVPETPEHSFIPNGNQRDSET